MTSAQAHNRIKAELEHFGIFLLRTTAGKRHWVAHCSECGKEHTCSLPMKYPTEAVIKKFASIGFSIHHGRAPAHTECLRHIKQEAKLAQATIGPDPKIARKIYALLDEHFNDVRGIYTTGKSDEWIARELDVSVPIVIAIREAAYGPLRVDPAVEA